MTITDSPASYTTTNKPRVCGFMALTTLGMGMFARHSAGKVLSKKNSLDTVTLLGAGVGAWGGFKLGCWLFQDHQFVDGSFVQLHTAKGVSGFTCKDE